MLPMSIAHTCPSHHRNIYSAWTSAQDLNPFCCSIRQTSTRSTCWSRVNRIGLPTSSGSPSWCCSTTTTKFQESSQLLDDCHCSRAFDGLVSNDCWNNHRRCCRSDQDCLCRTTLWELGTLVNMLFDMLSLSSVERNYGFPLSNYTLSKCTISRACVDDP